MSLFKKFTKCLNLVFPAKEALDFMRNYESLVEINVLAGKHLRDERLSMKGHSTQGLCHISEFYLLLQSSRREPG